MNESNQETSQAPKAPVVKNAEYLLKQLNRESVLAAGEYVSPYDLARAIANALMNLNPHDTTLNERLRHSQVKLNHCNAIVGKIKSGEFEAFDSDGVLTTFDGIETVIRRADALKYAANIGVNIAGNPAPTLEAVTPAPVIASMAVPKLRAQESRIIELLEANGYNPVKLSKRAPGKPGPKAEIKTLAMTEPKLFTTKSFDKAWERLRGEGSIDGAE